ncbi:bacterio-opsin activator HTH domain-containing protein [Halosimplex carlsbadense 2-9-1]|uniref:Bacterio-opsin activator HTH domain-containing protein n=1 Tax=Halosimplex carlsbadense 2-9-1 TaxID=797114 RepID=M0D690_9EURY|nr:helix-turn-helix domain-containing protein [Halosimplex carlsbadense]ELZ30207.1 bacterio-opsin activator HTH domain-containing protein [Halosimplex carlsbadense 2-9-1]
MRYLRVAVHQKPAVRHPMHQFVVEQEGYTVSRLIQYNTALDDEPAFLFHVDGDPDPYEPILEDVESVSTYEISRCPDDTFYLYVRETIPEHSQDFVGAFTQPGLVGLMPVEYRADGTVRLTAVGPAEMLQTAVDEMPEGMDAEVLEVGEYDARRLDAGSDLTDRQFEAVLAAVDCGYYETPSEGSVEDVGDRLDCAPGTAAELLRRAERSVMKNVASTGPF